MIPLVDVTAQHKQLKKQITRAIAEVIERGDFILGKDVAEFEKEFARTAGSAYAVGVSSGTAALFLALESLGIKAGDEVIVPAFTYIATALAVSYTGAKPVFVDIEESTYNIDTKRIQQVITHKTKAVIPVHLYGQPANMAEIVEIAKHYKIRVIEDAAQAHGATVQMQDGRWQRVGGIGDIGCFSFYPSKNLGAMGDGGVITTNDEKIYKRLLMLRDYGRVSRYEHAFVGYNSRLDTIQAAVLRIKLTKLDAWNQARRKAAKLYEKYLRNSTAVLPYAAPFAKHVYHVYAIRTTRRDALVEKFRQKNIGAVIHYPIPIHLQKAYESLGYKRGDFPVAEKACSDIISIPMFPHIKEAQIKAVAGVITDTLLERSQKK